MTRSRASTRSRFCSRIAEDEESRDEVEGGAEGFGEFVVTGGHAAKLFEFVKEAFDAVAPAVEFLVVGQLLAPAAEGRNDGLNPVGSQALADAVGVVTFVERGQLEDVLRVEAFVEGLKLPAIVRLACGQVEKPPRERPRA